MSIKLKYQLLILIYFQIIKEVHNKKKEIIILQQIEYEIYSSTYNLEIINLNREIYNMRYSLIANLDEQNIDSIMNDYTPYYNHFWLFLITDINTFTDIISKYKCINDYMIIYGIIVPQSMQLLLPKDYQNNKTTIFSVPDCDINQLKNADFRKNDKILYFKFGSDPPIIRYPEMYIFISSIILFCFNTTILLFWSFIYRTAKEEYITSIQKYFNILPYLNLLISTALIIKCIYIKGKDPYQYYEYMASIDIIFISLNSITKIILYYILIKISTGWKIVIQTLSRKIQIFYIKMIIFVFVSICMDITIYYIDDDWFVVFCEIKNIFFYFISSYIILKKIKKTLMLLLKKLYYANTLVPEFSEGLIFKIEIYKHLKIIFIGYPISFVVVLIIHKIIPEEDDSICLTFII